ncbi:MAG: PorV/PorQ family protein [Spirochaetia bacterium]|nr:PorV/PorQ family protein [Spirochaetia bacterium]
MSRINFFKVIMIMAVLAAGMPVFAANFGTTTAEFLKINPEAAPAGMGESYIAIGEGTNSLQYNAGGLALMDRGEATFTDIMWFNNINMLHFALGYPFSDDFGMGGSILWINYGSFDSTGGVAPAVEMQNGVLNFGAGKSLGESVHLGLNIRGLYENFMGDSSFGFSADAGAVIMLGSRNFTLGLTAKNLGILFGTPDPLPAELGAGVGFRLFNGSFEFLTVDLDVRKTLNADNFFAGIGVEGYIMQILALRFGMRYNNALEMDALSFNSVSNMLIFSAGAGFTINDSISIDYAYTPMGDLGAVQRLTLKYRFGDSRYAKKMADRNVKIEPKAIEVPEVNVSGGEIKGVSFKPNISAGNVKEWTLAIKTSDGRIVRSFSGVGEVPKELSWDGTDAYGRIAKSDVNYVFDFKARDEGGDIIKSLGHIVTPKQLKFVREEDMRFVPIKGEEMLVAPVTMLVSPDADERKQVPFVMINRKIKNVQDWEFEILDGDKTVIKKFTGTGMIPSYLVWDGKDTYGNYVTRLKDCRYVLTVNGIDGKKAEIRNRRVVRDTFVISAKSRRLKMAGRIFFDANSADITRQMEYKLDELAREISGFTNLQIYMQGHSSMEGDNAHNQKLSQDRAKSVLRYLVEKYRVSPLSITTVGYGADIPLDTADTEVGRMRNRRVEIIIIGEKK